MAEPQDRMAELLEAARWAERARAGGDANMAAFQGFLEDLEEMDLPDDVIRTIKMRGPALLKKGKLPKSLAAKLGGNRDQVKSYFRMAREASQGLGPKQLSAAVNQSLKALQAEGVIPAADIQEMKAALKQTGPEVLLQTRVAPEAQDPAVLSKAWSRMVGKRKVSAPPGQPFVGRNPGAGFVGPSMGKASPTIAGDLAPVAGAAKVAGKSRLWEGALGKAGTGPLKGAFRGAGGALLGAGLVQTAYQAYDELVRKPAIRANPLTYRSPVSGESYVEYANRLAAESGVAPKPLDYLRYTVEARDRLAQRKAVLFNQEPTLSQQLIATLAGEREDTSPLTRTEMSIGVPTPRSPQPTRQGVESMLDRLLQEMD